MADVFISYAREDRQRAEQIARGLQAMGLECFWDTEIPPGQTWSDYIEGKLSVCKAVIVLWSAHSTGSQWVREEARMGRDKGKLIPAMLDNSPAPFGFGEVQAANLAEWRGQPNHPDWVRFAGAEATAVRGANAATAQAEAAPPQPVVPPAFDFRAEMHATRVQADALLAEGRIEEAEAYMEARRQIFYDQGYHWLRRLNQAYFAFYGAYADEPGGADGEDPVGEAVRAFRTASASPLSFHDGYRPPPRRA